jgi:tRNA pseudouridine32 synthase/23S rRNA pseudouridine746 synthase
MTEEIPTVADRFTYFTNPILLSDLPQRFNFPFYYEPHPWCVQAAHELQEYLQNQTEWKHDFGLESDPTPQSTGKMFGVLIVQNRDGEIGYLSAVSGKLAGVNHHSRLVPPVFDMLRADGFFKAEEAVISQINTRIEQLELNADFVVAVENLNRYKFQSEQEYEQYKEKIRIGRAERKHKREHATLKGPADQYEPMLERLRQESIAEKKALKSNQEHWKATIDQQQKIVNLYADEIKLLKDLRKKKSATLQQQLYDQYQFLNQDGQKKGLCEIFENTAYLKPVAGAGECAAPKLLQYAFANQLNPLAMAEFWWGASPTSEIRKHGMFYPACRSKCEPILGHMLQGMQVDTNPWIDTPDPTKVIETVYEDEFLVVINKPSGLLSVPGTHIPDSVYDRMRAKYPDATGPLIVHRLDMATSGIMLIPKTIEAHHYLQNQFMRGTIKKRYVANLQGEVLANEGIIELPLRIDYDNRPQQMVCFEHGKYAKTIWKVVARNAQHTKVHFWPVTGRTHQLRMHAAHHLGLGCPIVGDILYGQKDERLHLHAEYIEFKHPGTQQKVSFEVGAKFY